MERFLNSRYFAWLAAALFFTAGLALIFVANGTCDDGDSIMHYQYARWAPVHHELFFHHWAKPLYVLMACPWAQFGLGGIKLFNLILSTGAVLLAFAIARHFQIARSPVAAILMALSPGLMVHALSGLTEPLFGVVLGISILLYLRNNIWQAVLIISFLPFVRSEGLIICGVFALMLLLEKRWKLLPLLAAGHIVYSIAGYPVYHNLLWVFTRIPYAKLSSVYGAGTWEHFFIHLPEITGVPLYALLAAGICFGIFQMIRTRIAREHWRLFVLVYGSFGAYFTAHVLFWKLGIFNSLGLLRVLIGVLPLMAVIELEGLNALLAVVKPDTVRNWVLGIVLAVVVIFPFAGRRSSWHYQRDFCLQTSQLADKQAADYIKANFPDYKQAQYYYDANYMSILLNIDYFDTTVSRRVWEIYEHPPRRQAFVIWDNYYSAFECQTALNVPGNNPQFKELKEFALTDPYGYEKKTVVFKNRE